MSQSFIGTIPPGGVWGGGSPPNVSTPFLPGTTEVNRTEPNRSEAIHKVASIWLKIANRVAYGQALIATRGFRARQNSYGFRAI